MKCQSHRARTLHITCVKLCTHEVKGIACSRQHQGKLRPPEMKDGASGRSRESNTAHPRASPWHHPAGTRDVARLARHSPGPLFPIGTWPHHLLLRPLSGVQSTGGVIQGTPTSPSALVCEGLSRSGFFQSPQVALDTPASEVSWPLLPWATSSAAWQCGWDNVPSLPSHGG